MCLTPVGTAAWPTFAKAPGRRSAERAFSPDCGPCQCVCMYAANSALDGNDSGKRLFTYLKKGRVEATTIGGGGSVYLYIKRTGSGP